MDAMGSPTRGSGTSRGGSSPVSIPRRTYSRGTAAVLVALLVLTACSGSSEFGTAESDPTPSESGSSLGEGTAATTATSAVPGTLLAPTSSTEPPVFRLPIEAVVAFLDACAVEPGLVGPCQCAGDRLDRNLTDEELQIFEDRFSGRNEFGPELAAALADCQRQGVPAAWSSASVQRFVNECAMGSDRLLALCQCAVGRAEEIVPEARLGDFIESTGVRPGFVELINDCL